MSSKLYLFQTLQTKKYKNKNKKVYKKEEKKSLFVNLKCSPRYSHVKRFTACSKTQSIVKHVSLSSDFYILSNFFSTTNFGVVEHKGSEFIPLLQKCLIYI